MFKKILFIFLLIFFLFSCGENESSIDGLTNYSGSGFTIRIPTKWELLKNDTNILPKPSAGNLELVTTSKTKIDVLYNSFIILSEDLETKITSLDYSKSNNLAQKQNYYSYNEISKDFFNFGEENNLSSSEVFVFDVKYNENIEKVRIVQTGIVCGKKGYILTLSIPTNIDDVLKYKYIFSNFKCKK